MTDDPDDRLTDAEVDAWLRAHGDHDDDPARTARIKARFDARQRGVRYRYVEPGEGGEPVTHTLTRAEALAAYYPYWCAQMQKRGRAAEISEAACLDDFVVVHWAEVLHDE